jgi:hypothetical protein
MTNNCNNGKCDIGAVGATCAANTDCLSANCANNVCGTGFVGAQCKINGDCHSNSCINNICNPRGLAEGCSIDNDCKSPFICSIGLCAFTNSGFNGPCIEDVNCISGRCGDNAKCLA